MNKETTPELYPEPPREEGKHRFMAGTCVDCGHPLDETCSSNLNLSPVTVPGEQREDMATKEFPPCPFIGKFNGYCLECSFIHRTEPISEARPARPEKIERWDLQEDKLGKFMKIVPSGEFVRWHQYAALEAQLSRLSLRVSELQKKREGDQEVIMAKCTQVKELYAKLKPVESAEDAWKRGWALGVQQSADYFGVVLTELLKTPYTPPISSDKEGQ